MNVEAVIVDMKTQEILLLYALLNRWATVGHCWPPVGTVDTGWHCWALLVTGWALWPTVGTVEPVGRRGP